MRKIEHKTKSIQLRYLDFTVKVGVPGDNDLLWLKEYLSPPFGIVKSSRFDCEIDLIFNDQEFSSLFGKSSQSKMKLSGFILDTRIVELKLWPSSGNCKILFDEEYNVFYFVSKNIRKITILAHSVKSIGFRTALGRIITELAMNYSRASGGHFIHSAALSYRGEGIMIAGPKNAGKTSLLIYLLQKLSAKFISNDRVLVSHNGATPFIYGMPTVITVSEKSLQMFPRLKNKFSKFNFHHRHTADEIVKRNCIPYKLETGEFTLSTEQFCRLLRVNPSSCSQLSMILFPRINERKRTIVFKKLSRTAALERLKESQFARNISESLSFFYLQDKDLSSLNNEKNYEKFSSKLAAETACYDCYLGHQIYQSTGMSEAIRSSLFQAQKTSS